MSLKSVLTRLADAIRTLSGESGTKTLEQLADLAEGIPIVEVETPELMVDSDGLIIASVFQIPGLIRADANSEYAVSSTHRQLPTQAAKTVTPSTEDQTAVESGVYTTGEVVVAGDPNLKPENIADGVSIFGVLGSLVANGGGDLPSGISALTCGTVTLAETVATYKVPHGLDVAPNFIVWALEDDTSGAVLTSEAVGGAAFVKKIKKTASSSIKNLYHYVNVGYSSTSEYVSDVGTSTSATVMSSTTARMTADDVYPLIAGKTYRWVCGVLDGIA